MIKQDINYLEKAVKLQKQAYKIIDDLQIEYRWNLVGKTILVGSASFGLMTTPNLDFEIYVSKPDVRIGFDTIREIAAISGVKQFNFLTFWEHPIQDLIGVLIIRIITELCGILITGSCHLVILMRGWLRILPMQ